MKYTTVLFDLDGTLIDTKEGIIKSFRNTFQKLGLPTPPYDTLRLVLGPPLRDCFHTICGLDLELTEKAIEIYRTDLVESGNAFIGKPFGGIPELIIKLKSGGMKLGVATSKVEHLARRVIESARLSSMFDTISGPSTDNRSSTKKDSVLKAIRQIDGATPQSTVLIGDRCYDAQGAVEAGIDSIGVFYGYGTREEILSSPFTRRAENSREIYSLIAEEP